MEIGSPAWSRMIMEGAAAWGLELAADQIGLFACHAQELLKWNAVTNLTAITDVEAVARNHFLDSLAPAGLIAPASDLLDVGTGGGFPGLPLHILIPGLRTTLLDASRKKVSFLRHVVRTLGLTRIQAVHSRVEDLAQQPGHAGRYDVILSRAFGTLTILVSTALPLLRPRGRLIALRGEGAIADIDELRRVTEARDEFAGAGLSFEWKPYRLAGLKKPRNLVVVARSDSTQR